MQAPADAAYVALLINGRDMRLDDGAFSMAGPGSGSMSCYGVWMIKPEEPVAEWAAQMGAVLSPMSEGFYINEVDAFRHPEQVRRSYTDEALARLREINQTYDPDERIHVFPGFREA